jgi:hypothetical protein
MMRNQKKWNDPIANAKYYGKTAEEIEEMWSKAGRDASAKGTAMHYKIECFYNTPPPAHAADTADNTPDDTPSELKYFMNFHNEHIASPAATLRPYRTEWTVFHEEARIAGSIDMVYEVIDPTADQHPPAPTTTDPTTTDPTTTDPTTTDPTTTDPTTTDPTPLRGADPSIERSCDASLASFGESRTVCRRWGADTPPSIERSCDASLASFGESRTVCRRWGADTPLAIYDWKRCREITKTNRGNKFATHPAIEHLPDTNYWHYALQLNLYKYILQTKYDKKITDLYIIVLHPEGQNYQRIKLPDLQSEVADLITERIRDINAKLY